jgi:hypothetical protein
VLGLCLIFSGRTTSPTVDLQRTRRQLHHPLLTIDITIADGNVDPSGEQIQASVGQEAILNVKSYIDEEFPCGLLSVFDLRSDRSIRLFQLCV